MHNSYPYFNQNWLETQYFFSCFHFWQIKVAIILLIDTSEDKNECFLITETAVT